MGFNLTFKGLMFRPLRGGTSRRCVSGSRAFRKISPQYLLTTPT